MASLLELMHIEMHLFRLRYHDMRDILDILIIFEKIAIIAIIYFWGLIMEIIYFRELVMEIIYFNMLHYGNYFCRAPGFW